MDATTVAIDLAKDVHEPAFAVAHGRIVERRLLSRDAVPCSRANRPPLPVAMEACGSTHDRARVSRRRGIRFDCCRRGP